MEKEFELKATLKIREAKADDAKWLHYYCFPNIPVEEVQVELSSDVKKMNKGEVYRLVAVASDHPIGNIRLEFNKYGDPQLAQIEELAVSPPFRSLKVADRLMECIADVAKEKGVKTLQVQTQRSESRVIEYYKEQGFVEPAYVTLQKTLEQTVKQEEAEDEPEEEEQEAEQQQLLVGDEK